jgi:hypothetical protein
MAEEKQIWLNFTNNTPNSQGSVVPNESLDFSRYNINPVILSDHDWKSRAVGKMTNIKLENGNWKGIPEFHKLNEESKLLAAMYEKGYLVSASIGGEMILKTTGEKTWITDETGQQKQVPVYYRRPDGLLEAEKFYLYEISLPTLPSNPLAVTDDALQKAMMEATPEIKIFEQSELETIHTTITTLSAELESKADNTPININQTQNAMAEETNDNTAAVKSSKGAEKPTTNETAPQATDNSNHVILGADDKKLPGPISRILKGLGLLGQFAVDYKEPDDDDKPQTIKPKGKGDVGEQPEQTGKMSAEASKKRAEKAVKKAEELKEKFDSEEDEEKKSKFKKEYEEACKEAESACKEAEEMEESAKESKKTASKKKEEKEPEEEAEESKEAKHEASFSAKPLKATLAQLEVLKASGQMAPAPNNNIITMNPRTTFSALRKDAQEGDRIIGRMFNGGQKENGQASPADYLTVLSSMANDPKYAPILKQLRMIPAGSEHQIGEQRNFLSNNPHSKLGFDINAVMSRLSAGKNATLGSDGKLMTTLSTSSSFSSLDTVAVEWLTLVLFKLFPSEDWKNEIPIFSAEQTGRNLGVIWTNILANAPIYRGTNPAPATTYGPYSDQSVGMTLVPYWQAPTLWQPLTLHQLRYDQMSTGWIQNLAALNAQIGDDLLYTLIAGLIANQSSNVIYTGGPTNANTGVSSNFTIPGSGSSFVFNPSFAGTLTKPGMNDVFAIEEKFMQQNYDLPRERPVLVMDSAMMRWMKSDPQTQSMLTKWVNDQGAELQKISHTLIHERSRVGAYDPASATVIDTHATAVVVPGTTLSAGLAFIASQVGIGLGLIDVFMIQDPNNYGYKMSIDLRINARALRNDYTGLAMYTYSNGVAQPGN